MQLQTLTATSRATDGTKGQVNRVRTSGEIPVVLYGEGKGAVSLKVNEKEFMHVVHGRGGEHAIVQLDVKDDPALSGPALLKAVQHHPVRSAVLHADFLRIRLDENIRTSVPITLTGQPRGVVEGGVLDHQLRELEVECLALEVPEKIVVDVSQLGMGESLHVSDLAIPAKVTVVTESERAVAAVHAPRVATEAAAAEGEAAEGEAAEGAESKDEEKES